MCLCIGDYIRLIQSKKLSRLTKLALLKNWLLSEQMSQHETFIILFIFFGCFKVTAKIINDFEIQIFKIHKP